VQQGDIVQGSSAPVGNGTPRRTVRIGVDTGGTFTDVAMVDSDGRMSIWKVPSQPAHPDRAVVHGVTEALANDALEPEAVARFVHGTTVATNTLLTGTGARVALVTTAGFRDVLQIGRQTRPSLYDLRAQRPEPLVPRRRIFEVAARLNPDGTPDTELADGEAAAAAAAQLAGCDADVIVVSLLNGYRDPEFERRLAAEIAEHCAGALVTSATDVGAEIGEYERTSTAVVNGYVLPPMTTYVTRLEQSLAEAGIPAQLWIMQSNGGVISPATVQLASVRTVLSGPAGGVAMAADLAVRLGLEQAVTIDIGGTSSDFSLITDGRATTVREGEIEGHPIRTPMLDIHTIGAGGGSIAYLDGGGALRVGPKSAGADPGPICYGRGGTDLTVTDAHLLLGRLGTVLLDGRLELDRDAAAGQLDAFAARAGLEPLQTAAGILAVATASMARGIRKMSVERGVDVRACALVAFGGAGPLHAADLLRELHMSEAVIPPHPGVASAIGMLSADVRHDFSQSVARRLDTAGIEAATRVFSELRGRALERLRDEERIPAGEIEIEQFADLRYVGQSFDLTIPWSPEAGAAEIRELFVEAHKHRYGYEQPGADVEIVTVRVSGSATLPGGEIAATAETPAASTPEPIATRRLFSDGEWAEAPVYRRDRFVPGDRFDGPALIEQLDSTSVVLGGQHAEVDAWMNLRIRNTEGRAS
jgi:N-methylhydantoinase A